MRGLFLTVVLCVAVVVPAAAGSAGDLAPAEVSVVQCGSYTIELAVGPTGSSPLVTRERDGRVALNGARGERVVASCESGCLEATAGATCDIVRRPPVAAQPAFSIVCPEGETWELDRNGGGGGCTTTTSDSNEVTGGSCGDGAGNRGSVDCSANDGVGRCVEEMGTVTCRCTTCI